MTTFTHCFLVILAYFQEVFPWIVYTILVSLHMEQHSSSNVRVGSDNSRLCSSEDSSLKLVQGLVSRLFVPDEDDIAHARLGRMGWYVAGVRIYTRRSKA